MLVGGCVETFRTIAASPAISREPRRASCSNALAARFDQVEIGPRYEFSRVKLRAVRFGPVPDLRRHPRLGIASDADRSGSSPSAATATAGHYRIERQRTLAAATRLGDTRHTIALERLAPDTYRWETNVDLAVGSITAEGASAFMSALFRSPEGRTDREVRDDYAAAFPRASAAFGRGFAVDSLRILPGALGTTSVSLSLGFHPETMRPAFPAFASYLDKYLGPAKYQLTLTDRAGSPLLEAVGRDRMLTVRYRLQRGRLVSLLGNPHPWPDTLRLNADVSLKVKLFTVGFHKLTHRFRDRDFRSRAVVDDRRAARTGLGSPVDHRAPDSFTAPAAVRGCRFDVQRFGARQRRYANPVRRGTGGSTSRRARSCASLDRSAST